MNGTQERSGEVIGSAASKVMWVGRATVFLVGLAVILAVVFGVATAAFAAATGDPLRLGQANRINDALTTLLGSNSGAMLAIDNDSTASTARALDLRVEGNKAPMRVNSDKMVSNLNADKLDGMHASQLAPRAYAQVEAGGGLTVGTSKGINDVQAVTPSGSNPVDARFPNNLYCFDLQFDDPKAAVGSPFINNNATIATTIGPISQCPETHRDAAVRTYTWVATHDTEQPSNVTGIASKDVPVSFSIAFM